jgi:PAS domain S-box-containing protein
MTDSEGPVKASEREVAAVRVQLEAALPRGATSLLATEQVGRILLESSLECVQLMDREGHLQFMNAGGKSLLEMDDDSQWRGKPWWTLWPASEAATLRAAVRNAGLGQSSRFQVQSQTAKGKLKWWDVSVSPVPREGVESASWHVVAVSRDITEQRIAEVARGKLAAIVHTSVDAIVSKDLNGVITSWNEAAERIFGYSESEAVGQSIMMLLPFDQQDEEVRIMARIRRGVGIEPYDTRRRRKDGTLFDVSVTISPILDSKGHIVGAAKIARDISGRKATEAALLESEARMRLATEATGVGIWDWHIATNTIRWDAQLFGIYGMVPTANGLVNYQTWSATVDPQDLATTEAILRKVIEGGGRSAQEFRIRRVSDGQLRHIHAVWTVRTNEQGRAEWVIGTNRDITTRWLMQEALTTADRRKDEFLATLAHELRNPLAPIRMGLEVLKRVEHASTAGTDTRAMMERQVQVLARLVDDLMDVSRISSGRLELDKSAVPLSAVLDSALETSRPLIEKAAHEFTYLPASETLMVYADVTRLAQVFINLLNNAAKYTPPGGRIQVSVERQGDEALVSVRDTGVGIAADALPYVFDMFTQIKGSSALAQGGLGIGLSLVKRLVELHDGTVEGRSGGAGNGAEFVVRLKLLSVGSVVPASQRRDPRDSEPK